MGLENRTGLVAVALLAITVLLLIITRIATSYDLSPLAQKINTNTVKEAPPSQGLSQHDIDIILGKAPPPAPPPSPPPLLYDTSVLGKTKIKKVAVILETRPLPHLLPLLLHFSSVLGPEWPIYLFTSPQIVRTLFESPAFNRSVEAGRIEPRTFPLGTPDDYPFHNLLKRAEFLTRPWFWESLMPADHVLMFSADSMICSKSWLSIDDFLQYDFIGAPLEPGDPTIDEIVGVSGTLSLRNREAMVSIARETNWEKGASYYRDGEGVLRKRLEDEWFWDSLATAPIYVKGRKWATLPDLKAARMFAVGAMWGDEPFGYDGALARHDSRRVEMLSWCPEYGISLLASAQERDQL